MVSICIIKLHDCFLSAVYGIKDILEYATTHNERGFSVFVMDPDEFIATGSRFDFVILPPFRTPGENTELKLDTLLVSALKGVSLSSILVSVCAGAFYLCATGISEGGCVTTHWQLADKLQKRYPRVKVQRERVLIDEGRYICAGGLTSFQDLSLYFVKKMVSLEAALEVAKVFLINPENRTQLQYMIFNLDVSGSDDVLSRAKRYMLSIFSDEIGLEQVASFCNVSVRTLLRHFHKENQFSPAVYLLNVRIAHAQNLLETTVYPVKRIASESGYCDLASFTRLFRKTTGLAPGEYRKRFGGLSVSP